MIKHSRTRLIGQAQVLLQRVNSEDELAELAQTGRRGCGRERGAYPGDSMRCSYRWRPIGVPGFSLAIRLAFARVRTRGASNFPVAHLPTNWGNEFVDAAQAASTVADIRLRTSRTRRTFLERLKASTHPRYRDGQRAAARRLSNDACAGRRVLRPAGYVDSGNRKPASNMSTSCSTTTMATAKRPTYKRCKGIVAMQKVYPRDRDITMLLYDAARRSERMTISRAATDEARHLQRDSHRRVPGLRPQAQKLSWARQQ